ncbi:MAG: DUF2125 domain-containing protein [Pseudomonadota bacterium]
MTQYSRILTTTALLSVLATGAFADVTAKEVWDSFKVQISAYGQLTADESQSGDTLAITGITTRSDVDGVVTETTMGGTINFRELGDGTVSIELPADMDINISVIGDDAPPVGLNMMLKQENMQIIASGTADNMTHEFNAPSLTYLIDAIDVGGEAVTGNMNLTMTDTVGSWVTSGSEIQRNVANYTSAALTIKGQFSEPGTSNGFVVDATINDLTAQTDTMMPEGFADLPPEEMFTSGFGVDGTLTYGATTFATQVTDDSQPVNVNGTIESGTFDFGMDGEAVRYNTSTKNMTTSGTIPGMPFPPVEVNMDSSSFKFAMPLGQTEEAQNFGLGVTMIGFTVSDFLWAMVDPAQQLPRDPANVVLDITGKANWLVDIFDPEAMANAGPAPGKIESLTLNDLEVTVAGASLTGKGDFTFDNDDLQTFGGVPRPQGAIDLAMSGGITLLDKLTAMNLVPQEQAMGIKMMSGLFAKPGAEPDTLTSRIEIDPSGSILANGQKIQ